MIEAKGDPVVNPQKMRYPYFVSPLGELVQRVNVMRHCRYALALPDSYSEIVSRKIPYAAAKRLDLEALLVKDDGKIKRLTATDFSLGSS